MKSLLVYITAFCVCLSLTWLPVETGAIVIVVFAMGLGFFITFSAWWRMIAGAFICVALCYGVVLWCVINKYKTDYYEPTEARQWMQYWLQYAIQMGAFAGGSLGLLLYQRKQSQLKLVE